MRRRSSTASRAQGSSSACLAFYARLPVERPRRRVELRNREAGDRPEPAGRRLARLRDPAVARDREEDEGVLEREPVLVDEQPRRLLGNELQGVVVLVRG